MSWRYSAYCKRAIRTSAFLKVERFGLKGGEIWTQRWRDLDKGWRDLDRNPQKTGFFFENLKVLVKQYNMEFFRSLHKRKGI